MLQGHKRDWGVGDLPTPRCSPTSSFARKEASAFSISWPRHPAALSTKANMPLRDLDSGMATVPLHFASTMDSTLNLRHRIRQQVVPTIFESTKMTGPSDSTSYAVSTIAVLRPGRSLFFLHRTSFTTPFQEDREKSRAQSRSCSKAGIRRDCVACGR